MFTDYADEAAREWFDEDVGEGKRKDLAAIIREACEKRVAEAVAGAYLAASAYVKDRLESDTPSYKAVVAAAVRTLAPDDARAALAERDERTWKAAIEAAARVALVGGTLRKPETI